MRAVEADGNYSLQNVAVGYGALSSATDAAYNVCIGANAGNKIGNGARNVCIGNETNPYVQNSTNQVVIGYNISGSEDNQVTIGMNTTTIRNEFDTDNAWTQASDVRKKKNIEDAKLGLDFINDLRPVTYNWKANHEFPKDFPGYNPVVEENEMKTDVKMYGLIAQEVKEAIDDAGEDRFAGWKEDPDGVQRISKEMFVFPLIKAVQELSSENKELKDELNELKILIKKKLGDE